MRSMQELHIIRRVRVCRPRLLLGRSHRALMFLNGLCSCHFYTAGSHLSFERSIERSLFTTMLLTLNGPHLLLAGTAFNHS
jgi:hypothetical protein